MFKKLQSYFDISYYRAVVLVITGILIGLSSTIYFALPLLLNKPTAISIQEQEQIKILASKIKMDTTNAKFVAYKKYDTSENIYAKLFPFDPNTASVITFQQLGLSEKLAHTIDNYRNHGGKFYNNEAFKKIWGLSAQTYKRLEPYITIQSNHIQEKEYVKKKINIELNTANTSQINQLPMIGNTLSQRIIEYRAQLGGFYTANQLLEVYGISQETYRLIQPFIHVNKSRIKKININTVLFQNLKEHPYFRNNIALSILQYRRKKQKIENIQDIKNNISISEQDLNRIENYIVF